MSMNEAENERTPTRIGSGNDLGTAGQEIAVGRLGGFSETAEPMAIEETGPAEPVEGDPRGNGTDLPRGAVDICYVYVMASDHGIVKVGISTNPVFRLVSVRQQWPIIRRIHAGYGMSVHDAAVVERTVHRKLLSVRHEKELFKCHSEDAMIAIEQVIHLFGITFVPFIIPDPDIGPLVRIRRVPKRVIRKPVNFMLEADLHAEASRYALIEERSLTNWIGHLIQCEVAARTRAIEAGVRVSPRTISSDKSTPVEDRLKTTERRIARKQKPRSASTS